MIHTFVKGEPNWVDPLNANFQEVATTAGGAIPASEKGAAGGVASLDGAGKLMQMPTAADVGAPDVEPLTWTPRITIGGAEPTGIAYAEQRGWGVRIGKLVYLHANITLSNKGTAAEQLSARIVGLPYAIAHNYHAATKGWAANITQAAMLHGEAAGGGIITLYTTNAEGQNAAVMMKDLANNATIEGLSLTYIID